MANQRPIVWKSGRKKEFQSGDNLKFHYAVLSTASLTAERTFTFPDIAGDVLLTTGSQTITGAKIFEDGTAGPGTGSFIFRASSTGNVFLDLRSAAGTITQSAYRTGTALRWLAGKDAGTESGSNAGAPYTICAYDDAGTAIGNAIEITRATRVVNFPVAPTFGAVANTRTNLGLGTAATQNTGTSGATLPFCNTANTWLLAQTFTVAPVFTDGSGSRTALGLGSADNVTHATITGTTGTFSSLEANAGTVRINRIGDSAAGQYLLDVDAGFAGQLVWRTGTSARWLFNKTSTAESGSDAGSNFSLTAFDDSGASLGDVFTVVRATRVLTFVIAPVFTDASGTRTNLGLAIGTNVQAYNANLAAIAGQTTANNKLTYWTGSGTAALADFTAGGRALVNSAGTANTFPRFSSADTITLTDIAFGTYTPTLSNTTNVAASTAYTCTYLRVGSVVFVHGRVDIDVTAGSVATLLGMSLPIASNLAAGADLAGTAAILGVATVAVGIVADTTNDRASFSWNHSADTANRGYSFHFSYRVI